MRIFLIVCLFLASCGLFPSEDDEIGIVAVPIDELWQSSKVINYNQIQSIHLSILNPASDDVSYKASYCLNPSESYSSEDSLDLGPSQFIAYVYPDEHRNPETLIHTIEGKTDSTTNNELKFNIPVQKETQYLLIDIKNAQGELIATEVFSSQRDDGFEDEKPFEEETQCYFIYDESHFDYNKMKSFAIYAFYSLDTESPEHTRYTNNPENPFTAEESLHCYKSLNNYSYHDYDKSLTGGKLTAYVYNKDKTQILYEIEGQAKFPEIDPDFKRVDLAFHMPFDGQPLQIEIKNSNNEVLYTHSLKGIPAVLEKRFYPRLDEETRCHYDYLNHLRIFFQVHDMNDIFRKGYISGRMSFADWFFELID